MNMLMSVSGPFINTELIKSLFVDSDISQSNNIPFDNILSSLLGNLQLQHDNHIPSFEEKEIKMLSQRCLKDPVFQYLFNVLNKTENQYSENNLKEFLADHKDEDLEYNPEDINQIIFFKEIYNYLSQSGHFPIKIEERREVIQFIDREGKGVDLPGIDTKDLQTFKTSLIHAIREAIQLFTNRKDGTNLTAKNHFFLNEPQISDFDLLPFTKSVGGEAKFLEKDVLPVFIREIKSSLDYTHNIKPIIAEDILNANEVVTQGKLSRDKGHNQTFNFNNFSGTENTFFSIENNNGEIYMDFNAPDKPLSLDDKYNDLYTISKKGDASIEISLEPNGMGEIDIELVLDKGVINAQINASENIGKEFIEKNLDNIMRVLISEGLHIGSFSVSLQNKEGTSVYGNKKEDIQDIRLANVRNLSNAEHNEGLISIFV